MPNAIKPNAVPIVDAAYKNCKIGYEIFFEIWLVSEIMWYSAVKVVLLFVQSVQLNWWLCMIQAIE